MRGASAVMKACGTTLAGERMVHAPTRNREEPCQFCETRASVIDTLAPTRSVVQFRPQERPQLGFCGHPETVTTDAPQPFHLNRTKYQRVGRSVPRRLNRHPASTKFYEIIFDQRPSSHGSARMFTRKVAFTSLRHQSDARSPSCGPLWMRKQRERPSPEAE